MEFCSLLWKIFAFVIMTTFAMVANVVDEVMFNSWGQWGLWKDCRGEKPQTRPWPDPTLRHCLLTKDIFSISDSALETSISGRRLRLSVFFELLASTSRQVSSSSRDCDWLPSWRWPQNATVAGGKGNRTFFPQPSGHSSYSQSTQSHLYTRAPSETQASDRLSSLACAPVLALAINPSPGPTSPFCELAFLYYVAASAGLSGLLGKSASSPPPHHRQPARAFSARLIEY